MAEDQFSVKEERGKGRELTIREYGSNDEVTRNALKPIHIAKQPLRSQ